MWNLLIVEFKNLKRNKMFFFFSLILILNSVINCFNGNPEIGSWAENISDVQIGGLLSTISMFRDTAMPSLIIIVLVSLSISQSFQNRTINLPIVNGVKREKIIQSKFISHLLIANLTLFSSMFVKMIFDSINYGWSSFSNYNSVLYFILIVCLFIIQMNCVYSIGFFAGIIMKNTFGAVTLATSLGILNMLPIIFVYEYHMNFKLLQLNSFIQIREITDVNISYEKLILAGLSGVSFLYIMYLISVTIFKKSDLK